MGVLEAQESVLSVKCQRVSADQRDFCMFAFMHVSVLACVPAYGGQRGQRQLPFLGHHPPCSV